ncbi:MAG: sulfotransferase [Desulfamplus sp.]|nr:sulfotransferase [Desulfamplus sp.]
MDKIEENKEMKYIYIVGSGHSGSTLFDLALSNQNGIFSLGEFRHVQSEWINNHLCACGVPMLSCPIWPEVLGEFSKEELWIIASRDYHRKKGPHDLPARFVEIYPRFLEKLSEVTGCSVISDSSKSLHKLNLITLLPNLDLRILYLRRDVGGVAASQKRKGKSAWKSSLSWIARNVQIQQYLKHSGRPWSEVRYEELVLNPEKELEKIFQFLEIELKSSLVNDFSKLRHIVKGNRIRESHTELTFRKPSVWQDNFSPLGLGYYRALDSLLTLF